MTSSTMNTQTIALRPELFSTQEELALAGFLAGYSGLTREVYMLDLRQYVAWCAERRVALFGAHRADIEAFGRHLETAGRARATISRRLCTIACFYRYAEQEDFISKSPAVPAFHSETSKKPRATLTCAPRCDTTGLASRSIGTPPTSSGPSSPAPPVDSPRGTAPVNTPERILFLSR